MSHHNLVALVATIVLSLILVAGIIWLASRSDEESTDLPVTISENIQEGEWVIGEDASPVTIIVYSDFECPSCKVSYDTIKTLLETEKGKVKFVFRHMPLSQIHPNAQKAAEAAEAAGVQGRFWEMHDIMFQNQDALTIDDLKKYAEEVGVGDLEKFKTELDSGTYAKNVLADRQSGLDSGVVGTPTYFVDGERYDGDYSVAGLRAAIRSQQ